MSALAPVRLSAITVTLGAVVAAAACGGSSTSSKGGPTAASSTGSGASFSCSAGAAGKPPAGAHHHVSLPAKVAGHGRVGGAAARQTVAAFKPAFDTKTLVYDDAGLFAGRSGGRTVVVLGHLSASALHSSSYGRARLGFVCTTFQSAGLDRTQAHTVASGGFPDSLVCDSGQLGAAKNVKTTICIWWDDTVGIVITYGDDPAPAEAVAVQTRTSAET
jgi:FlaG/FlaF family flagellin (archaellin)